MTAETEPISFDPSKHFRNLKGQLYLEVKFRLLWARQAHPNLCISTDLIQHDAQEGLAVFKARCSYVTDDGHEVFATGYGSETRKDFLDYVEKSETKGVGRALAMLGYGTAQAIELDEGEALADSPVDPRTPAQRSLANRAPGTPAPRPPQERSGTQAPPQRLDVAALRKEVSMMLAGDAEAAAKLPKGADQMNEEELVRTKAWLNRRANAVLP